MNDDSIEIEVKAKGIPELRSELKQLKSDLANATDPTEMERLARESGVVADKIKNINEQVAIFNSGSDFEAASNSLNRMQGQLSSLDLEGAAESAQLLASNIKNMNPTEIANGFKNFASTIGTLSKAFVQMGLKLLTNPLFLLVAVIGAIIVIVITFKDKIGILQKAFDLMMTPINLVIGALKELGDWLGLTAFAAEESAERQIKAAESVRKGYETELDNFTQQIDREIALKKAAGETTIELEIEKQQAIADTADATIELSKKTIKELENILKQRGKLTEEENKLYEETTEKIRQESNKRSNAINQIEVIQTTESKKENDKRVADEKTVYEKKLANQKAAQDKTRQELIQFRNNLKAIEVKYQDEINDLITTDEIKKLELQKSREQRSLDEIKLSKEEKLKAQLALDQKYKILTEKLEEEKQQRIIDITNDYSNKLKDSQAVTLEEKFKRQEEVNILEEEQAIQRLVKEGANEEQIKQVKDYYLQINADNKRAYDIAKMEEDAELKQIELNAEEAFQSAKRNALDTGLNILQSFAGKNKTIALGILAIQKGLAIADVVVGAAKSIAVAKQNLAAVPAVIGAIPNPMYKVQVAATLKGIATTKIGAAASIASILASGISSAKSIGASGGGSVGGTADGGSAPVQPSFQLFGGRNQGNEATSSQTVESNQPQNQTITVNAIVSETEVTETQNRVRNIQQNAEL